MAPVRQTVVGVRAVVGLGLYRVATLSLLLELTRWKLPAASVKPIGAALRWSCQLLTKKNTWVAFWSRLVRQEKGLLGFQLHGYGLSQNE